MIKLSVNETKGSSLLASVRALMLHISISIFDFGTETLPGLSRNGPLPNPPPPPRVSPLQFTAATGNFVYFKYKPFVLESCCFSLVLFLFIFFIFCFGFFYLHLLRTLKISTLFSTDIQLN